MIYKRCGRMLYRKFETKQLLSRDHVLADLQFPYLQTLFMCQRQGLRIGVIPHNGWPCVAYVVDGLQYRFRKGLVLVNGAEC